MPLVIGHGDRGRLATCVGRDPIGLGTVQEGIFTGTLQASYAGRMPEGLGKYLTPSNVPPPSYA